MSFHKISYVQPLENYLILVIFKDLAAFVKEVRKEEKNSQKQLSEMSGLPQSSIARIESWKSDPQLSTFSRLLTSLGYKINIEKIGK